MKKEGGAGTGERKGIVADAAEELREFCFVIIEGGSEEARVKCYLPERGRRCQKRNSHWGLRGCGKHGQGPFQWS